MTRERATSQVVINQRHIGPGQPCFIIAEAGVNHNGEIEVAMRLVDAAVAAGADAVKFQTFKADRLAIPTALQYTMLRQLELSREAHMQLLDHCRRQGIVFLSSPFDEVSADLLETLGVEALKIPSGELTNLPLLRHVARKGKPMIVSTGMADVEEVACAIQAIEHAGHPPVVLLHCVSAYPAPPGEVNLRAMRTLADRFAVPVGYSDHTHGIEVALAAVALGACVIEKHLTLDRRMSGPDHAASVEPDELHRLVDGIRIVEAALGHGRKEPTVSEAPTAVVARKSLVAAKDIAAGTRLTEDLVTVKRPGIGLPPTMREHIIGKVATRDIPAQTVLSLEMMR